MKMFGKAKSFLLKNKDDDVDFNYLTSKKEPDREMKKLLMEEAKWKESNSEYKAAADLYM